MSAITYPTTGRRRRFPNARPVLGFRRRPVLWRTRRWDDRPSAERNVSPSEVAMRSIATATIIHR